LRRPVAGFHPFIYGTEAPDFPRDGSRDSLAHYIERGRPQGRWTHRVLRPDLAAADGGRQEADPASGEAGRPVALHGHFHYPENIREFMVTLAGNRLSADLFLTTTSEQTADILREATADYSGGEVVVDVGPNVGRDIFAFLRVLRTHIQGRYDLVGHLHGKRSVHTVGDDPDFGDRWRGFLWEHLLGPSYPAADVIVDAMRRDAGIGLVFPEDGSLVGWEENGHSRELLARRIGFREPLPSHIEFPAGTMFWARVDALSKLVAADFREEDMPVEPLPIDGTVLHALERMLPLLCEEAGYDYATSYIPDIHR
jgi:lipopolysaccharide biosynthesis protein